MHIHPYLRYFGVSKNGEIHEFQIDLSQHEDELAAWLLRKTQETWGTHDIGLVTFRQPKR